MSEIETEVVEACESLRLKPCPVCGSHVGAARLYELRGAGL